MLATPRFSEDSLYKQVNRTNLTKNQLNSIEPNRPDCCSIGSVIAHNLAGIFRRVRLIQLVRSITEEHSLDANTSILFGRKTKPMQFQLNLD